MRTPAELKNLPTGWYAISVNLLRGYPAWAYDATGAVEYIGQGEFCGYLALEPAVVLGYSIYVFEIRDWADQMEQ
jgi:hypothetical protein